MPAPDSSRRPTSSASVPARSTSSHAAAWSASPLARSRKACRPSEDRPELVRLTREDGAGLDDLVEALALAGYERVERVEERGQIAVRGGLVDIFPSTGREPLRVEFFGDEIEQIRAFSPFTQRALHPVDDAVVFPAREALQSAAELALLDRRRTDLVPLLDRAPDLVWQLDDVVEPVAGGGSGRTVGRRRGTARCTPALAAARVRGAATGDRAHVGLRRRRTSSRRWSSRDGGSS